MVNGRGEESWVESKKRMFIRSVWKGRKGERDASLRACAKRSPFAVHAAGRTPDIRSSSARRVMEEGTAVGMEGSCESTPHPSRFWKGPLKIKNKIKMVKPENGGNRPTVGNLYFWLVVFELLGRRRSVLILLYGHCERPEVAEARELGPSTRLGARWPRPGLGTCLTS